MIRTALAVRHVAFEDLGILEPLLTARGYEIEVLDAGVDDITDARLADADLLVVLGGPVSANDTEVHRVLQVEIDGIAERLRRRLPTLGVCLGAQLIARAAGARVFGAGAVEIGYAPLELTDAGRGSPLVHVADIPVLHWHGETFDVPAGAVHLASTGTVPHQAFAIGAHTLALQFHLEADPATFERWLIGHAHELAAHGIDVRELRRHAAELGPRLTDAAIRAFGAWIDGAVDTVEP